MLIVNFPLTKAMHISASRIEPNFTTDLVRKSHHKSRSKHSLEKFLNND